MLALLARDTYFAMQSLGVHLTPPQKRLTLLCNFFQPKFDFFTNSLTLLQGSEPHQMGQKSKSSPRRGELCV